MMMLVVTNLDICMCVCVCVNQLSPVSADEQAMVVEALPMVRRVPRPPVSHKPRVTAPTLPPPGQRPHSARPDLVLLTVIGCKNVE